MVTFHFAGSDGTYPPLEDEEVKPTLKQILLPIGLALTSIALTLLGGAIAAGGSFLGAPLGAAGIVMGFIAAKVAFTARHDGLISGLIVLGLISITGAICFLLAILMPFAIFAAALTVFVSGGLDSMSDTLLPFALFVIVAGGPALLAMRAP